jgi:hypothetical protein
VIRDALKVQAFWDRWIDHYVYEVDHRKERLEDAFEREDYRPQYVYELSKTYFWLALHRYSRGDAISELPQCFEPLLCYWEEAEKLGLQVWTPEQQRVRHTWSVNLDFYIDCFWLVSLALALEIPDAQWQRLIALIGNEGQDALLDRIIATRTPSRQVGTSLCYRKPYARLLEAIDAPRSRQASLLAIFVECWYEEVGAAAKSGREKQAVPHKEPYWRGYHRLEGGYFGYWCLEALAAVKAFGLDDSQCIGHPHYPGDLLRPGVVTTPNTSRLPPELFLSVNALPQPPFVGESRQISSWEALRLLVKNKFGK